MKKLLLGVCALMTLAVVSCGKCQGDKCSATNDSLSTAYGNYVGAMINSDFTRMADMSKDGKKEFLKGFQTMIANASTSENSNMGMQVAMQLMNEINQLKEQGIDVDQAKVVDAFKKTFLTDSLSIISVQQYSSEFQELFMAARQAAEQKLAVEENGDAIDENGKAAEEFVATLVAENPNVQTTEDGLVYVIEAEGEGAKPAETATVVVNYTGKHLNGEVFDSSEGRGPATFPLQGVIKGFKDGLMLLGKGGKATLYIPGDLGYGPNGQPAAGIGPNEMLVFEVELLDIQGE